MATDYTDHVLRLYHDGRAPEIVDDIVSNQTTTQRLEIVELGVYPGVPLDMLALDDEGKPRHFPAEYRRVDHDPDTTSQPVAIESLEILTALVNSLTDLAGDPEREPTPWAWNAGEKAYTRTVLQRQSSHPKTLRLGIITPEGAEVARWAVIELHDAEGNRLDITDTLTVRFDDGTEATGVLGISSALARLYPYSEEPFSCLVPVSQSYIRIHGITGRTWTYGTVVDYEGGTRPAFNSLCVAKHLPETPDARIGQGVVVQSV